MAGPNAARAICQPMGALDLRNHTATEPHGLVLDYLRNKSALLVTDNCEHLMEAAAFLVSDVLSGSARFVADVHP